MTDLPRREFQTILRVGYEAASAPDLPRFRGLALAAAHEVVDADVVTYNEIDRSQGAGYGVAYALVSPEGFLSDESFADFQRYAGQHPLIAYYAETHDGRARKISDFLDREAFHALDLYRTVFAPTGLEYQIAITLPGPPTQVIGLALSRGDRDFSERERGRLNLLRPLLAQAYQHIQERDALRGRLDALDRALAHTTEGLVLLTPAASVDYASPRARELLPELSGPRLPKPVERWLTEDPLRPLVHAGVTLRLVADARLGVLLVSETGALPAGALLTPRELEVLASVADGHTDQQIAVALGLSVRTVQRHIANIFDKLEVHNRTAAVARVFG